MGKSICAYAPGDRAIMLKRAMAATFTILLNMGINSYTFEEPTLIISTAKHKMNTGKPQETPCLIRLVGSQEGICAFWEVVEQGGLSGDREYYERCLQRQEEGDLDIILAFLAGSGDPAGFCLLNWQPKYALFKKLGIPEIQDLNVLRDYRKQGIGRAIIEYCEARARERGAEDMGIGVGLDSRFGAAQRLYVRLGYIPDGSGVSYDRKQIACGEMRPVDENLCLMMTKPLF